MSLEILKKPCDHCDGNGWVEDWDAMRARALRLAQYDGDRDIWDHVVAHASNIVGVRPRAALARSRKPEYVTVRHSAMWVLRNNGWTYRRISAVAGRDHGGIRHSIMKFDDVVRNPRTAEDRNRRNVAVELHGRTKRVLAARGNRSAA